MHHSSQRLGTPADALITHQLTFSPCLYFGILASSHSAYIPPRVHGLQQIGEHLHGSSPLLVRSHPNLARLLRRQALPRHRSQERDPLPPAQPQDRRAHPPPEGLSLRRRTATAQAKRSRRTRSSKATSTAKASTSSSSPARSTTSASPPRNTLEVKQFVDLDELDPEFFEKPYFVVPDGDQQAEAFAVVREALHSTGKVALGKIAFSGREHLVAISAPPEAEQTPPPPAA